MRMRLKRKHEMDIKKTTWISITANVLQIVLMLLILAELLIEGKASVMIRTAAVVTFVVIAAGAAVDISDALAQRRLLQQMDDMDATIDDLETLNNKIRAQRHDFLNHLQVVYGLMEMEEYQEAGAYIEKVYGDITALSRTLKTANPSINALLQVKMGACEQARIQMQLNIRSRWENLPMPGWEMCKVLGNLIDNAMDALQEVDQRCLTITLTENLHHFCFTVANNGPMIPVQSQKAIFDAGVTGKGSGHGMGLYIVQETMKKYGGDISLSSTPEETSFSGYVPREIRNPEENTRDDQ